MKRIVLALFAALLVACTDNQALDPALGGVRTGAWVRAEAEQHGKPIVWELRENIAVDATRSDLLIVSLHYRTQHPDGQPDTTEQQIFAKLEQQLVSRIGDAGILAAVLTYDQQHDWYFFAAGDAAKRAHTALEESERAIVSIENEPGAAAEFHASLNARINGN